MTPAKILIADDEPLNLLLFAEMIKPMGHTVALAADGLETVQKIHEIRPDLIILDWNMPRLDGLETLIRIKSEADFKETPVIMITGIMTSPENLKQAMEAGAIDFLRKPFDKIELQARVASVLMLARSQRELNERLQTIERNNKFIQALMEAIPHPFIYYNLEGTILGYNNNFNKLFGAENINLIGTNAYDLVSNTGSESHRAKDLELVRTRTNTAYQSINLKNNNDYILSKSLVFNPQGEPENILSIMTDITELNRAHNEIIESKKRELTSSTLRLIQNSEMNNSIIGELEKLNQHTNKTGNDIIKSIVNNLSLNVGESIWQEFEMRFENVYESFYRALNKLFPDLTQGEKKLCALLRLNLSSKEIATLMFQNSQSVDMARYRLRKKLNLKQNENLTDFLMTIDI
jgi:PAS domain S-box-containing protein